MIEKIDSVAAHSGLLFGSIAVDEYDILVDGYCSRHAMNLFKLRSKPVESSYL